MSMTEPKHDSPDHQQHKPDARLLLDRLDSLVTDILDLEQACTAEQGVVPRDQRDSLRNLVHYLALRRHDLRDTQHALAALGLSSLGRSESHVLGTIDAVRSALAALAGLAAPPPTAATFPMHRGEELLQRSTTRLLGHAPAGRHVRIMVTMPSEAATDPRLVRELVAGGMDVMRINCAHDDRAAWAAMIQNLRAATTDGDRPRRVLMDVEGPKLRTGPIAEGPRVVSWNPPRSVIGDLLRPCVVWITRQERPVAPAVITPEATLMLPGAFVDQLRPGERITFTDQPGRSRLLTVNASESGGVLAQSTHSAYVTPGTEFRTESNPRLRCTITNLPAVPGMIELTPGDQLVVTADPEPGRAAVRDDAGRIISPACISLSPGQIFTDLRPGHRVMLDDGKAVGVVDRVDQRSAVLRIIRCRGGRFRLGPEKGINLPDTDLNLPALSEDDAGHLPFIAANADMIGFSFVQRPADIDMLRDALAAAGRPDLGLVLKIETAAAFARLPELLMSAMRSPAVGVMIARGDLATQIGYERLAEVQEEILWICEAAHVPVMWATQVLETLAKKGLPSRSEITDAAMGERAECVMLNKGPFVLDAVRLLDNILRRMAGHQSKKRSMMRPLSIARRFGHL
ncbi:MAG: pyruvate kinase [Planctomycetes bacterium]|nr:pyruvate kinase [Planctomycetota bacterium]